MASPSEAKNRIYLVDRAFQLRYAKTVALIGLGSTLLTAFVLLYPLYMFEILQIPGFLPMPIFGAIGAAVLANVGFLALSAIVITHRIAGPTFSFIRQLRRIGSGKWGTNSHLSIRKDDELANLVRNFNSMVSSLAESARVDLDILTQLITAAESTRSQECSVQGTPSPVIPPKTIQGKVQGSSLDTALSAAYVLRARYWDRLEERHNSTKSAAL